MINAPIRTLLLVVLPILLLGGCQPDLKVTLSAEEGYAVGDDIAGTVSLTVENAGSAPAPGAEGETGYMVDLVLSSDATVPIVQAAVPSPYVFTEDMLLNGGRISNTETLAAGASKNYDAQAMGVIPSGTPSDAYLCAVVDPLARVAESKEGNNTACVAIQAKVSSRCVTFETQTLGTQYGSPAGHVAGDQVFVENGIVVRVEDFHWASGGTFNTAEVMASTPDFGTGSHFLWTNNINLELDFTGLGFTPSKVTFDFEDLGGHENLAINGDPPTAWVGELTMAPTPLGGVAFATSPQVMIGGGYKSVGTVTGAVQTLRVGGQEFGLDQICAWP